MKTTDFQLLPFQREAVLHAVEAIYRYDGNKNKFTFGSKIPKSLEGMPKPYLHRIRAITGAGKTPILAAISSHLKDCIILWTTPRGAIIEQTTQNLKGKYNALLGNAAEVFGLDEALRSAVWNRIVEQASGCTIITTTVAAFNQKEDKNLVIHKGMPSPWQQLCGEVKRPIWVFYDEGHNATENQFQRLLELHPRGFLLASASPLAADLQILLPGEDKAAKELELNNHRTTVVDTKQVVAAGLLKRTIEIHDLDTGDSKILETAYKKREYLESLAEGNVIACYIVDRDAGGTGVLHGFHIWEELLKFGADPSSIAVHLLGAEKASAIEVARGKAYFKNLRATYDQKLGPEELKKCGFKHIIWNLSLEEGWDEPWAYVGYFHGEQANENKVIQRIGRLIRNPFKDDEGMPEMPAAEPLRSVYCYLNTSNDILKCVVDKLQAEMDTACLEVLVIKESSQDRNTQFVEPKNVLEIPRLSLTFDPKKLENELFKALFGGTAIAARDYIAEGKSVTLTMNIGVQDSINQIEEVVDENVPTTIGEVVKNQLLLKDSRLIRKRGSLGGWISPLFWTRDALSRKINYSSRAYSEFKKRCDDFVEQIDMFLEVELDNDQEEAYRVDTIHLINPNGGVTDAKRKYYKVHSFKNALHSRYNCLNEFELQVAETLDLIGVTWMRNPARVGYGIPLVQCDNSSATFYPDFIVWNNDQIFFNVNSI